MLQSVSGHGRIEAGFSKNDASASSSEVNVYALNVITKALSPERVPSEQTLLIFTLPCTGKTATKFSGLALQHSHGVGCPLLATLHPGFEDIFTPATPQLVSHMLLAGNCNLFSGLDLVSPSRGCQPHPSGQLPLHLKRPSSSFL